VQRFVAKLQVQALAQSWAMRPGMIDREALTSMEFRSSNPESLDRVVMTPKILPRMPLPWLQYQERDVYELASPLSLH
jgi:hypothetical protein